MTEASPTRNENSGKSLLEGIEKYDEITRKNNKILADPIRSDAQDGNIATTVASLMISSNKNQFSLFHLSLIYFIIPQKAGYCNHLRVSVCLFVCLFVC